MQDNLIGRLRLGDSAALEAVMDQYSAYAAKIIAVFLNRTLTAQDMEETLSDVFVALWNSRERLEGEIKPYLAAIARNAARQKLRRYHPAEPLPENEAVPDEHATPEQAVEQLERTETVRAALAETLSPEERELFLRFYYLQQTVLEIAAVTGENPSTLKSRLKRGRKKLKQYLTERGLA